MICVLPTLWVAERKENRFAIRQIRVQIPPLLFITCAFFRPLWALHSGEGDRKHPRKEAQLVSHCCYDINYHKISGSTWIYYITVLEV
jgi:hypothetical protein